MQMQALAETLLVPPEKLPAFAEVFAAKGERGAQQWESLLLKVRSASEVEARIDELPELLAALAQDERMLLRARERLVFCGRYSSKAGTPLDEALRTAAAGLVAAAELSAKCKVQMVVSAGIFGDEHERCRAEAFPYRPSVSASAGSRVLEARAADGDVVERGTLLGYVAMQGGGCEQHSFHPCPEPVLCAVIPVPPRRRRGRYRRLAHLPWPRCRHGAARGRRVARAAWRLSVP
jgi:hypothetical protein